MNPWIGLVLLILLYPIVKYLAIKDIDKQRKKEDEYYKNLEAKRKAEYYDLLKEAERDAEIDAKLEKIHEEYKTQNNPD